MLLVACVFFFFSSRRRHTRWPRDWSSDVCSSDLLLLALLIVAMLKVPLWMVSAPPNVFVPLSVNVPLPALVIGAPPLPSRSEERRVGKACRSRLWTEP